MDRKIIKAEVLITRRCNLHCDYCNMPANKAEISAKDWIEIFEVLTDELGCPFYPIYGAEPLLYSGIYEVLEYFSRTKKAMYSLLTNATALTDERKKKLLDVGLDSITLSVDGLRISGKGSIAQRNDKALEAIDWAIASGIRDIQGTSCVHRGNIQEIPDLVRFLTDKGVWYSFDFIHDNKGTYDKLSKVSKRTDQAFVWDDLPVVRGFLIEMAMLKEQGYKIYQPKDWFHFLLSNPLHYVIQRSWYCSYEPSWVTIDADGTVLVCDDYLQSSGIYATDLPEQWDYFVDFKRWVVNKCRGCIWCTHWLSDRQVHDEGGVSQVTHGRTGCVASL